MYIHKQDGRKATLFEQTGDGDAVFECDGQNARIPANQFFEIFREATREEIGDAVPPEDDQGDAEKAK